MGRAPCCDKANVKKGPWSPEEDAKLKSYIHQNGTGGNWIALPQKAGLKRCGKSCRLRWLNYLRPNLRHGGFSEEEDSIICSLYVAVGSRWSLIAAQLPGRTDNDIKNYWNTKLKKKLFGKSRKSHRLRSPPAPEQEFRKPEENGRARYDTGARLAPSSFAGSLSSFSPDLEAMFCRFDAFCGATNTGRDGAGLLAFPEAANWSGASPLMLPPVRESAGSMRQCVYQGRCNMEYSDSIGANGGLM